jgi:multidrug efflux pump
MSISRFCIDRPIFATVVSIVITLAGAVAMFSLPVAQYPDITPPQISVSASYPGASASVVSENVASPIEQQINGADNMIYMSSSSSSTGSTTVTAYFEIGTNPELAQVDVQNRVNLALPTLPEAVQQTGVAVQKRSSAFMMVIGIFSPDDRYDAQYVANYANLYVLDTIKRIPGAGQTSVLGSPDLAMRIWLKPDRMAQLGVSAADVQNAVAKQNQQFAVGRIGQTPTGRPVEQSFNVTTLGRMTEPQEFDNIIIRATSGGAAIVRLKDIGRAELGLKDYSIRSTLDGKPATVLVVYQQPGANALQVSAAVTQALVEMKKTFPQGMDYRIAMDTTAFTRASIETVVHTFFEALVLVVLVVFLFLQSLRATLIPILAVPIAIVGTAVGMAALGFSINMLTLFGMVLAIGIVVDDAIVVIEAVEHNMNKFGLSPKEASYKAMDEVGGALVAIVLVLCAVFVPVAFIPGITGQMYKQFAITIAISVVISGVVALTLSPALAALLLQPGHEKKGFFKWFDARFEQMTRGYTRAVAFIIRRSLVALLVFAGMIALAVGMLKTIPGSFLPVEDQGYLLGAVILPDAASLDRTEAVSRHVSEFFGSNEATRSVMVVNGYSLLEGQTKSNAALFFVGLKEFGERYEGQNAATQSAAAVIAAANKAFSTVQGGVIVPINPPSIPGLGTTGGLEAYLQARGESTPAQLADAAAAFVAKARENPAIGKLTSTYNAASQQLMAEVARDKAEILDVPVQDVYSAMQTMFGSVYVSQFSKFSRLWQVIMQAEPSYRLKPQDLEQVYVRSRAGHMVPLKALVTTRYVTGPTIVSRFNNFPAAYLSIEPAPGYSSGQAIAAMESSAAAALSSDYALAWTGQAFEEKKAGSASTLVFVFGLVMVFLILSAQYEKWTLPLGVLMAVPFALFGALLAILLRGLENDIYFQIGLTMLVALAAKNAILIFEYAVMNRAAGESVHASAMNAARDRLRPIVMTSLAFILGCVPLALASGVSAASKHSIGTGVIGGMLGATAIAVFFIPMFYFVIESLVSRATERRPAAAVSVAGAAASGSES